MAVLFVDVAIQPEVRFIAKQNSLMKIGNNGNLVLGPFDESTPCLMIVLMNCQTKLRINHLTAVKSVAILEKFRKFRKIPAVCLVVYGSERKVWGTTILKEVVNCYPFTEDELILKRKTDDMRTVYGVWRCRL
ncbi:alpha-2 adrenergic receptor [Trichonephila clavipes]|nr:alpha-2 adrenergic receptor [Trichonephila clavipes]